MEPDVNFALELAELADGISMARFRARNLIVDEKADFSPVTEADRDVEQRLRARIAEAFPDHAIVGEDPDLRPRDDKEFTPRFTAEASGYPFMRLGNAAEENDKAWKNLERVPWYQPVARASDRATVLAVTL